MKQEIQKNDFTPTPVAPGMKKTGKDNELCKKCVYWSTNTCMYLVDTKESRNCPVGWCDKYKKGVRRESDKADTFQAKSRASWKYSQAIAHQNDAYFGEDGDN